MTDKYFSELSFAVLPFCATSGCSTSQRQAENTAPVTGWWRGLTLLLVSKSHLQTSLHRYLWAPFLNRLDDSLFERRVSHLFRFRDPPKKSWWLDWFPVLSRRCSKSLNALLWMLDKLHLCCRVVHSKEECMDLKIYFVVPEEIVALNFSPCLCVAKY